jgi:hypothetical protein
MKSKLKRPGTKRLKLEYEELLSNFGFKFWLRRYNLEEQFVMQLSWHAPYSGWLRDYIQVGRCRLTLSNPL